MLDFEDAHLKTSVKHIASNLDPVREIRLGAIHAGRFTRGDRFAQSRALQHQRNGKHGDGCIFADSAAASASVPAQAIPPHRR